MIDLQPYIEEFLDVVEDGADDEYYLAVIFADVPAEALAEGLLGDSVMPEEQWVLVAAAGALWMDDLLPLLRQVRWSDDEQLFTFADWAVKRFDPQDTLDDFWRALSAYAYWQFLDNLDQFWRDLARFVEKRYPQSVQAEQVGQMSLFGDAA